MSVIKTSGEFHLRELWHPHSFFAGALIIVALFILSRSNYLLFHTITEGFVIIVGFLVFILATRTYQYSKNNFLLFLGIAFLFIPIISFFHLVTYKGMDILSSGSDTSTQLWIAGRYLMAAALLCATYFINRKLSPLPIYTIFAITSGALLVSILYLNIFPTCFVEGQGFTSFMITSKYIIAIVFLLAMQRLYINRKHLNNNLYMIIMVATAMNIIAVLSFTLYTNVYGVTNFLSHVFQILAFYLVYLGIVRLGMDEPYSVIFRELARSRDFHLALFEDFPALIWRAGLDTKCNYFNRAWLEFTGRTIEQETGHGWAEGVHPEDIDNCLKIYLDSFQNRRPFEMEYRLRNHSGEYRWVVDFGRPFYDLEGEFAGYIGSCYDITERKQAESYMQLKAASAKLTVELAQAIHEAGANSKAILKTFSCKTAELFGDASAVYLTSETDEALNVVAAYSVNHEVHPGNNFYKFLYDTFCCNNALQSVFKTGRPLLVSELNPKELSKVTELSCCDDKKINIHSLMIIPLKTHEKVIGALLMLREKPGRPYTGDEQCLLLDIAERVTLAITNAKLYSENMRHLVQLRTLYTSAQKTAHTLDSRVVSEHIVRTCVDVYGANFSWLGYAEKDGSIRALTHYPVENDYTSRITVRWDDSPLGQGPMGRAIRGRTKIVFENIANDPSYGPWREAAVNQEFYCSAAFPLISRDKPFGALNIYSDQPGFFTRERLDFFQAYAYQAAAALENARLFEKAKRQLDNIQALRNVDMAIASSRSLRITLNIVLDQLSTQQEYHVAAISLVNNYTQELEYAVGRGLDFDLKKRPRLRLGEGFVGRAILGKKTICLPDIASDGEEHLWSDLLPKGTGIAAYYGVPLYAKGEVKGMLELFHRSPLYLGQKQLDFLESLAMQTSIAIDNANLFEELKRSNVELSLAYDATIEGWSYALDLRDKETEGHSRRVTEMTVTMAKAMGISEEELVHVYRGALLHDIGKMGVPDQILLKPQALTKDEWQVMALHPVYAYQMLSPIKYLRPALDIPYCHHEKWDGTGYPHGLKGEQIPLAARIFAVVDVCDALRSNRPYRPAWPEKEVIAHIRQQSGKHFDPKVVKVFMACFNKLEHNYKKISK